MLNDMLEKNKIGNKTIKIGDTFIIESSGLWKFDKESVTDGDENWETYTYNEIGLKEDDVLFIVKYIGNGLIQEMVTGQILVLNNNMISGSFEDEDKIALNGNGDILSSVCAKIDYYQGSVSVDDYVAALYQYRSTSSKSSLIYHDYIYEITSSTKDEYLKYSDEKRREIIEKALEIATKSRDKVVSEVDATINLYLPSLSADKIMRDMEKASLENKIFDFENSEKTK